MIEPKEKIKSFRHFEGQFIAPYPLEQCQKRLEYRAHKKLRITVKTWRTADDAVGFRLSMPGESRWVPSWHWTRAEGELIQQADGTTQVIVDVGTTFMGYALYWGMFILPLSLVGFPALSAFLSQPNISGFIFLGILVFTMSFPYRFSREDFNEQHGKLLEMVEFALR